jgi:cytidylate kinase
MTQGIRAIVDRQITRWNAERKALEERKGGTVVPRPVIAISRQMGSGGAEVAKNVARRLDCQLIGYELVDEIASRAKVRKDLLDCMDERVGADSRPWLYRVFSEESFDEGDYHKYLPLVLGGLMELGSVVFLGRGAGFVPAKGPRLRVRIVASLEKRLQTIMAREACSRDEAENSIKECDGERAKFVKRLVSKDISAPLEYDLIINTDDIHTSCAAALLETAWVHHVSGQNIVRR